MAGEMYSINQNGKDDDGNIWELHAEIARAIGGRLQPFDQYQGPYIVVGSDIRMGQRPYQVPIQGLGVVRLWVFPDEEQPDDFARIYREDIDKTSEPFFWPDTSKAISEAKRLLSKKAGKA